ncbi:MAG: O-antigen ligase family protein, partial [Chloroflexota bacterium]
VAVDYTWSIYKIFLLAQEFLLYVYLISTVKRKDDVVFIMTVIMVGLFLEGMVMIGLVGIGRSIETGVMTARIDPGPRVGGTIGGPNTASSYLGLVLAPTISMLLIPVQNKVKFLAMGAAGLGAVGMIVTLSRGGWIAMIVSVGLLFALMWYRGWMSLAIPIAIGFVGLVIAIGFSEMLIERLTGDDNGSADARMPLMMIAFRIISAYPILGIGSNNFATVMMDYAYSDSTIIWLYIVHNKYLLEWAEVGTLGFIGFIWFLWATLYSGIRAWMQANRFYSPLALGLAAGITGHMIHMNFDVFQGRPLVQMLWTSAALIVIMRRLAQKEMMETHDQPMNMKLSTGKV